MKIRGRILITIVQISCLIIILLSGPLAGSGRTGAGFPFLDEELTSFLEAKNFIFGREWARAVNAFQNYFKTYPAGSYRDEAGFWLAKAMDGLAGEERTMERVLNRKTEAVEALNRLEKEHPQSPWLEEARSFRRELLSEIALVGGRKREAFLAGFLKEENKTLNRARLDALSELITWDRGWAAPVVEDLLKTVADPEGRKEAVRFAARFFPDETETLLRDAAVRDADAGVRAEAAGALERLEMERIPVTALHFIFTARLTDAAAKAMLPEATAKVFDLSSASELSNKDAERKADELFKGKLRRLKMKGAGMLGKDMSWIMDLLGDILEGRRGIFLRDGERVVTGGLPVESRKARLALPMLRQRLLRLGETSAQKIPVGDVTVVFPLAACRKTADSFSGQVIFESGENKSAADFSVDSRRDQLAAFRRGSDVWLVVLQFDTTVSERLGILSSRLRPRPAMVFKDVLGCRVESSRGSWSLEEITSRGLIDFGQAKAEIPGASGRWRLEGFLLADMVKKIFIGRNAELFDPSGKSVVQAAEVLVPAGAPDKYEVVKK
ncbi:MAG: hypothetical protein OEW18_00930 [Candidatus Aminicenantes bacterium]|nr:hypothetical protein [Candidatus Aminicenantes bacterium]